VACIDHSATAKAPAACADCVVVGGIDLTSPEAASTAFATAAKQLGGLDGIVNVAGGFRWETVADGDIATWDFMFNVNVRTAVNAIRAALPLLKSPGARIVNIGAASAIKAGAGMGSYAASKAGVAKLSEALADELKDRGITVNAVLPSIIDTPVNRADMPTADFERWVKPQQVADLIVFLLSERASAITGALIPITGRV
jgi:NAD(P)-dependent dehydrogenase (short-subunit alcohol dehydrogenase family)